MSSASAAPPRRIPCWNHDGPRPPLTEPAILTMHFPLGELPVKGAKCPRCGEEVLTPEQVDMAQQTARRLGLFGPELRTHRAAIKLGSSTAMTFDQEMARRAGIAPGTELDVDLAGGRIVVSPRGPGAGRALPARRVRRRAVRKAPRKPAKLRRPSR